MSDIVDSRRRLVLTNKLLKTDFSEEEKMFRLGLASFHSSIESANKIHEFASPPEEPSTQPIVATDVAKTEKKPEQNPNLAKENRTQNVELGYVSKPKTGEPTLQPAQPKEQQLSTPEDDIFGDCTSPDQKNALPQTVKVAPKAEPKASAEDDLFSDDFFGESPKKTETKAKVEVKPEPKPVVVAEDDLFGESPKKTEPKTEPKVVAQEAEAELPSVECPWDDPVDARTATSLDDHLTKPSSTESDDLSINFSKYTLEDLVAMKVDPKFLEMMNLLEKMLKYLPEVDLFALAGTLHEYSVNLGLDPEREDTQILSRRMKEVEIKRDALYGKLMMLKPHSDALKHATEWIMKVGPGYSSASSEQKRIAEIKMLTDDVWLRYALVDRVHNSFEETYSHLGRQMDTISRLVTCDQNRLKHMEMRRGTSSYDDAAPWEDPKPSQAHSPRPLPPKSETEEEGGLDEAVNQKMSQPLDPKKYKDLQSMPTDTSKIAGKAGKTSFQKGDFNW